jgi:hypothetical protein
MVAKLHAIIGQEKKKMSTDGHTERVATSILELLIAAKKVHRPKL